MAAMTGPKTSSSGSNMEGLTESTDECTSVGVSGDEGVYMWAPGWEAAFGVEVGAHELRVVCANGVGRSLQVEPLRAHEDSEHVVRRVTHGLFHVVRVEILHSRVDVSTRAKAGQEKGHTLAHQTISAAAMCMAWNAG